MTRTELIQVIAERFPQLSAGDTEFSVKTILAAMHDAIAKGDRVEIRGFGVFHLNYRPPRTGRNPKSGTQVNVPGKYAPHFRAGKELREAISPGLANTK